MRNLISVGKICLLCIWPREKMIKIAIQTGLDKMVDEGYMVE